MDGVDRKAFFDSVRASLFGGSLSGYQVGVLDGLIDQFDGSPDQLAYVMATPYHEVGPGFIPKVENLNYTANRMMQVWPKRFPTLASTNGFVRNPRALANRVYGGRFGNTEPDDGWRYRGRGFSQITFKDNYEWASELTGVNLVANPELASDPEIASKVLIVGMVAGKFTGKKLADFITAKERNYVAARAIINADVAANGKKIAGYAEKFRAALIQKKD